MKRVSIFIAALLCAPLSYAGLITHTDYTAGSVITAAGQNANENTIVNEFNGHVGSTNIETGGVTSTNILDGTIVNADLNSTLQSTVTLTNNYASYKRPALVFASITSVDVDTNTTTNSRTCIVFPVDGMRCVTENVLNTSVNRRFIITETASFSGTKNSGMTPGEAEAANKWYAIYAVKAQDNSTDFVLAGTTNTPSATNSTELNRLFGTNGWVYLGMIRNGDNSGATSDILNFQQNGNITLLENVCVGNANNADGIRFATTAGATSITYSYTSGTGTTDIPGHLGIAYWGTGGAAGTGTWTISDAGGVLVYGRASGAVVYFARFLEQSAAGLKTAQSSSVAMDIFFQGWVDNILGVGSNPQL